MRIIILPQEKTIVVEPAKTKVTTEVSLNHVIDNGSEVIALMYFDGYTKQYTLWDSTTTPTYEAIGQWTDSDVDARLNELL